MTQTKIRADLLDYTMTAFFPGGCRADTGITVRPRLETRDIMRFNFGGGGLADGRKRYRTLNAMWRLSEYNETEVFKTNLTAARKSGIMGMTNKLKRELYRLTRKPLQPKDKLAALLDFAQMSVNDGEYPAPFNPPIHRMIKALADKPKTRRLSR